MTSTPDSAVAAAAAPGDGAVAGEPPLATEQAAPPRVLVVDADRDTLELIEVWLAADGCVVAEEAGAAPGERFDLAVVDVPYPRQSVERLRALRAQHPDMPLLVLSATLFSSAECSGPCAKALGVAGVLPKPTTRDALIAAVRRLARPAGR